MPNEFYRVYLPSSQLKRIYERNLKNLPHANLCDMNPDINSSIDSNPDRLKQVNGIIRRCKTETSMTKYTSLSEIRC